MPPVMSGKPRAPVAFGAYEGHCYFKGNDASPIANRPGRSSYELLLPPPRELLDRGPLPSIRSALERFERGIAGSPKADAAMATDMGLALPH